MDPEKIHKFKGGNTKPFRKNCVKCGLVIDNAKKGYFSVFFGDSKN